MELTQFIEELLGIELKPYQKLAIENFYSSEEVKPKCKHKFMVVTYDSEFHDDGYYGSTTTKYTLRNIETGSNFVVNEDDVYKYGIDLRKSEYYLVNY